MFILAVLEGAILADNESPIDDGLLSVGEHADGLVRPYDSSAFALPRPMLAVQPRCQQFLGQFQRPPFCYPMYRSAQCLKSREKVGKILIVIIHVTIFLLQSDFSLVGNTLSCTRNLSYRAQPEGRAGLIGSLDHSDEKSEVRNQKSEIPFHLATRGFQGLARNRPSFLYRKLIKLSTPIHPTIVPFWKLGFV